jgi:quinol monooxygenase YgiN
LVAFWDNHSGTPGAKEGKLVFLRFVHLKVTEDTMGEMHRFYEKRVIPTLQATNGCLFASLLEPTVDRGECISMTLWVSQEHAEAYESSGTYDLLLDETDEAIAAAARDGIEASVNASTGPPPMYDPDVEGYPVEGSGDDQILHGDPAQRRFLRIVAARVEPGRFEELRERYEAEVAPTLLATPGCHSAFVVQGLKARARALSVTIWESEAAAVRYELSGKYEQLVARISELFSGLYQWKLSLYGQNEARVAGSELEVSGYNLVAGRRLGD